MNSVDVVRAVAGAAALVISGVAIVTMVAGFIVKVVRCVRLLTLKVGGKHYALDPAL